MTEDEGETIAREVFASAYGAAFAWRYRKEHQTGAAMYAAGVAQLAEQGVRQLLGLPSRPRKQ